MKRFSIFALAAVTMFVGCTKDIDTDIVKDDIVRGELVTKTLVFEDSRVERDEVSGKLSWNEGDQVAVVLKNGSTYSLDTEKYTVNLVNGEAQVTIPSNAAYMVYPANLTSLSLSGTTLSFRLAHVMGASTTETVFDICPMKGTVDGDFVTFKNLMAFAKFPIKGTGKLKSAVLRTTCRTSSEFHPISNTASIDITKDIANGGGVKMATNNSAFTWMRQNFNGEGIDLSTNPSLYFPLPEGEYENMGVVVVTDNGSYTIYANNKHTFTRSKVKPVSANPINLAAHKPANPTSLTGNTGKANEDYASCYIVPPTAGEYGFPCILADGTEVTGGVTAEIKWAEKAGMVYDLHYNASENTISFKTNGEEGNALIVLTDIQNIVWSWHLWITDTPKTLKVMGTGSNSNVAYYLMDRVVGATWSPASTIAETSKLTIVSNDVSYSVSMNNTMSLQNASDACGVYFQYQNRIPFPRIKSLDYIGKESVSTMANTRCDVMYGFSQYGQYWSQSPSAESVWLKDFGQYVHKTMLYPNYQYNNNKAWTLANVINEYKTNNNSVLVSEGNYRFWNSINSNDHDNMMKGKTAHDPCPPGYIMENSSITYWYVQYDSARKAAFGYTRAAEDNAAYYSGFKYYGMYLNASVDSDGNNVPLYFPCAGNRDGATNSVSGQYGNCGYLYNVNTSNPYTYATGDFTTGKGVAVAYGEIGSAYKAPALPSWNSEKTNNEQAYNVRCRRGKF